MAEEKLDTIYSAAKSEDNKDLWLPASGLTVRVSTDMMGMRVVKVSGLLDGYTVSMGGITASDLAFKLEAALREEK